MAYDIGTARGIIEMEYNGRGVDQAQDDLKGLKDGGGNAQQALGKVSKTAGVAGLAIAAGLGLAVNAAANFEQRMSAIGAVSGASAGELDKLRNKALQLGKDTAFSAGESAQAMEELVKAGLSVDDVLNGAADATVALAAAGEIDLPQAATIASNAMNQFGLSAEDMVGVVDNIAGAANASAIDVGDFGQSLTQVGAVANLAGVSFEDVSTAIALMGNAGIKGSDAGTSLKSMFQRLQPVTAKQTELFQKLGLITEDGSNKFYDAQGNLKDLSSVSGILTNSLKGMTAQQKQATLQTLFGTDAIRAAAVLTKNGAKGFDEMAASMGKVSAADVAAKRMDNLKGSIEQMKGSLETLGISLGTIMLPALRSIVDALTGVLNVFLSLSPGTQKFIVTMLAAVAAILLIGAAIGKMIIFAAELSKALAVLRVALAGTWIAALGPIGLIIVAVLAVIAVILILWHKSETFRSIILGIWAAIQAAAQAVANWFMGSFLPAILSVWDQFKTGLSQLAGFFQAVWSGIVTVVKVYITIIATIIRTYIAIWVAIITTGLNVLKAIWSALWGTFGGIIKAVFALIVAIVKLYWTIIKGVFLLNLMILKAITMAVFNGIKTVIQTAMAVIRAVVGAGVAAVRAVISAGWNAIRAVTNAIWNGIMAVIRAVWGRIGGTVRAGAAAVLGAVSAAWGAVRGVTTAAWNAFVSIITGAIGRAMAVVSSIRGRVLGALSGAASWLYGAGQDIIQGLLNGIESMIGKVTGAISKVTGAIGKFLPGSPVKEGPLKKLNRGKAGKEIVELVIDGISAMADPLTSALDGVLGSTVASSLTPPVGATPRPTRNRASGDSRRVRMVDGELRLHKSGRAFITGLAIDADDDNSEFDDLIGRMG